MRLLERTAMVARHFLKAFAQSHDTPTYVPIICIF
jgi:hypothetical protein